ncbi:hypothetical protein AMTR_s00096p00033630 [Amborella trichopoda]|uniref:Uncharacterized protein n=1 Tax=Amborella trichopoda TaxID=13333 RepID=W1P3X6_AMBTC|nr:hypothetical protein AMTR_s00096p00033630 [Amborella trichopoda]
MGVGQVQGGYNPKLYPSRERPIGEGEKKCSKDIEVALEVPPLQVLSAVESMSISSSYEGSHSEDDGASGEETEPPEVDQQLEILPQAEDDHVIGVEPLLMGINLEVEPQEVRSQIGEGEHREEGIIMPSATVQGGEFTQTKRKEEEMISHIADEPRDCATMFDEIGMDLNVPIARVLEDIKEQARVKRLSQKLEKSIKEMGKASEIKGPKEGASSVESVI